MRLDPHSAIGVFDSGVGGLTVVRALMERLPFENIMYFGDTARVPYGVKSVDTITYYTQQIAQFLLDKNVKILIIACNTMAAVAAQTVRDMTDVPVLDVIEAGALAAAHISHTGQIGVIGTPTTINSNAYARAIYTHLRDARVYSQACPLFVPLVEEGWLEHQVTRLTAQEYLRPVIAENVDTLVLGCTHYPLIKPLLRSIMGEKVKLVDSAEAMAHNTAELLAERQLLNPSLNSPEYAFYVTDVPVKFQTIGERFLGRSLNAVQVIKW